MTQLNCLNRRKIAFSFIIPLILAILCLSLFSDISYAVSANEISLQGKIVRNDAGHEGLNVVDGTPACVASGADTCDFQIKYYSAVTAGTLYLTETLSDVEIGDYGGIFNLSLNSGSIGTTSECKDGTCNTVIEVLNDFDTVYIEIGFAPLGAASFTETFTRTALNASPYAIRSEYAEGSISDSFKFYNVNDAGESGLTTTTGSVYYNTTDSVLKVYNGGSWVSVGSAGANAWASENINAWSYSQYMESTGVGTLSNFSLDVDDDRLSINVDQVEGGLTVFSSHTAGSEWPLVSFKADGAGFDTTVLELTQDGTGDILQGYKGSTLSFQVDNLGDAHLANDGILYSEPFASLPTGGQLHPNSGEGCLYMSGSTIYWDAACDAVSPVALGSGSLWTDGGTFTYLSATADDLVLGSNATATSKFFFDVSEGRLGIGTDTPSSALDIGGASSVISNSSGDLTITPADTLVIKDADTDVENLVEWQNSSATVLGAIDKDGDFGVGVGSPSKKFEVNFSSINSGVLFKDTANSVYHGTTNPMLKIEGGTFSSTGTGKIIGLSVDLSLAGASYDRVAASFLNGNVGIGTASPTSTLDIARVTRSGSHASGVPLYVTGDISASSGGIEFRHTNATQGIGFGYNTIYAAGSNTNQGLYLLPKGSHGIGLGSATEATANMVSVYGNMVVGGGTYYNAAAPTSGMLIEGDVGIGVVSPATKLDIDTGSNTLGLRLRGVAETAEIGDIYMGSYGEMILSTVAGTDSGAFIDIRPEDDNYGILLRESDGTGTTSFANFYVKDDTDDYLSINVNSVTDGNALVVTASDKVGIGTTAPGAKLDIETANGATGIIIGVAGSSYDYLFTRSSGTGFLEFQGSQAGYTGFDFLSDDSSHLMTIIDSGNVGIGTNTPTVSPLHVVGIPQSTDGYPTIRYNTADGAFHYQVSSLRYKEDVQPLEDYSKILLAEPITFKYKASEDYSIGFIAEEFDRLGLTDLVYYNESGQPDSIFYDLIPVYNVGVLKEQDTLLKASSVRLDSIVGWMNSVLGMPSFSSPVEEIDTEAVLSLSVEGDEGNMRYNTNNNQLEFSNDGNLWISLGDLTKTVTLSAEYAGAVLAADGSSNTGFMKSDAEGYAYNSMNYYEWNSSEVSMNDYDVRLRFTLPSDFVSWSTSAFTFGFATETNADVNNMVDFYIYEESSATVDGSSTGQYSSTATTWTTTSIAGSSLTDCNAAGETCVVLIRMYSGNDSYTRVGDIDVNYIREL